MDERPDNEVFAELQERYLAQRDPDTFWKMYLLIHRYEKRCIRKYCRQNNLVKQTDEVDDLAGDMALWFMKNYERPDFKAKSMSSYGHWAFVKIMREPNRMAEEMRKKALLKLEPNREENVVFALDTLETPEERQERTMRDEVAPGEYQGVLPFEEWTNEDV